MGTLPPGTRASWEPSALGSSDPINYYGTSLALELLPYWTKGRIGSMEGLYFESSATTSFHFLTVSELAAHPSNPVRGLVYGSLADFDRGVKHLQMLGVRYYMAWTPEAEAKADANPDLTQVASIADSDGLDPKGWKVYEVAGSELVQGLDYQPVVVQPHAGTDVVVLRPAPAEQRHRDPELGAWECTAARVVQGRRSPRHAVDGIGTEGLGRVDGRGLATAPRTRLDPVKVTNITEDADRVAFHVDKVGVPVVVKESYFPNWEVHGADGPYRLAPNLMVVIPRQHDVALTYGLTPVDWLGRIVTLAGLIGLVGLVLWKGARRYGANAVRSRGATFDGDDDETAGDSGPTTATRSHRHHSGRNRPRRYHDACLGARSGGDRSHRDVSLDAIFKAYDIRGIYPDEIDETVARRIGNAFATFTGASHIVVGHDMRTSSPARSPPSSKG